MRLKNQRKKEIDGLRGVAVLLVLFSHLQIPYFNGGFIGVDIFFVISGFVITNSISLELSKEEFRIQKFFERRIRRLFPPLFLMLIVLALYTLSEISNPKLVKEIFKSIIFTNLYNSNFYFWRYGNGYFESSQIRPLLHTWSLSVEEQFYFLFPPLLYFLYKYFKKKQILVIGFLTLLSLITSIILTNSHSEASFYLLPTRAWELGAGVLLSLANNKKINLRTN